MDKIIQLFNTLSLRKWILIYIGTSLLGSMLLFGAKSSLGYISSAIVSQVGAIILLGSFTVYAVADLTKAKGIIMSVLVGFVVALIGVIQCFDDSFSLLMNVADIFSYQVPMDDISSYYQEKCGIYLMLENLIFAIAMACGLSSLSDRYRWPWIIMMIGLGINAVNYILSVNFVIGSLAGMMSLVSVIWLLKIGGSPNNSTEIVEEEPTVENEKVTGLNINAKSQELFKLKELLDAGVLSQAEFDEEKSKILNQ